MSIPSPMFEYLSRRAAADAAAAADIRREVRGRLAGAVDLLARRYGVSRVVLFGSHARASADGASDIDLLVFGLDPLRQFEAIAELERWFGGPAVDLVRIEDVRDAVAARAEAEGEVLLG